MVVALRRDLPDAVFKFQNDLSLHLRATLPPSRDTERGLVPLDTKAGEAELCASPKSHRRRESKEQPRSERRTKAVGGVIRRLAGQSDAPVIAKVRRGVGIAAESDAMEGQSESHGERDASSGGATRVPVMKTAEAG